MSYLHFSIISRNFHALFHCSILSRLIYLVSMQRNCVLIIENVTIHTRMCTRDENRKKVTEESNEWKALKENNTCICVQYLVNVL